MLDTVLAGLGSHAISTILPSLQSEPRIRLLGFLTRSGEKAARLTALYPDARIFSNLAGIPARTGLLVCAGNPTFNLGAIEFAQGSRVPVFVEKPLSPDLPPSLDLARVQVGYNLYYSDFVRMLRDAVRPFGPIRHLAITYCTNKPRQPLWEGYSLTRSFLLAIACHPIHLATEVYGFSTLVDHCCRTFDNNVFVKLTLKDADGNLCTVVSHNFAPTLTLDIEALFDSGHHVVGDRLGTWRVTAPGTLPPAPLPSTSSLGGLSTFDLAGDRNGFRRQFADMAERLLSGRPLDPTVGGAAGARTNQVIAAILS